MAEERQWMIFFEELKESNTVSCMQLFTIGLWINRLSGHIMCKPQIVITGGTEMGSGEYVLE